MPETDGGGAEIPAVELPNALRIRQRLGQISTGNAFRDYLVPSVETLDKQALPPDKFIAALESRVANYAEEHVMGMVPPMLESLMPKIIDGLVDDEQQKKSAFEAWEARVAELKGDSVRTSQHIQSRYLGRQKLPRKRKKAQRKGPRYRA